jgi:hypothetical protein
MGRWQFEPLGAIDLGKTLHPPTFRRPLDFESVAFYGLDVDIAFESERDHPLAATLANFAERIKRSRERTPVSSMNSRRAATSTSSPSAISPLGIDHDPSSLLRQ